MPTTRRDFIKRSAAAVSVSLIMPKVLFAAQQNRVSDPDRRILVLLELTGGNDGLNVIIPHSDANYHKLRPTLGFHAEDLKDVDGNSTVINDQFGFHPSMKELKKFYDEGKLAPVLGLSYPNQTLSHFEIVSNVVEINFAHP